MAGNGERPRGWPFNINPVASLPVVEGCSHSPRRAFARFKLIGMVHALRGFNGIVGRCLLLAACLVAPYAAAGDARPTATGVQHEVVFTDYPALSGSSELLRRLLSPLNAMRVRQALAQSGRGLRDQPIDLRQERFAVYVPPGAPPAAGYALLVFVPPWPQATVPDNFIRALNRHRMIFVTAAHSGNDSNVMDRRIPLALLAEQNIVRHYRVDPRRVFIGGLSGGSRVALRIALAYPDIFHGVLLNAGSDPIGDAQMSVPPADLFRRFQQATRLVYLTGGQDQFNLDADARSRRSLRHWCVFDVVNESKTMPWTGHQLADPAALDDALGALEKQAPPDPGKLADCRRRVDQELATQEQRLGKLVASGQADAARAMLDQIDTRFGGLAAAQSLREMDALHAQP